MKRGGQPKLGPDGQALIAGRVFLRNARLNELHTLQGFRGVDFPDVRIDTVSWWDRLGKHVLQKEGYSLEGPVTIEVPPGCAVIFDAWLLHAGCEYRESDPELSCRLHFYFWITK